MAKQKSKSKSKGRAAVQQSPLRKTLSVLLSILLVLDFFAVGLIGYTIYYYKHNPPTTTAVGKVDALAYDSEGKYAMELNIFSNDKKNGLEVSEFRVNYYIDTLIPETDAGKADITQSNTDSNGNVNASGIIADCFKDTYTQGVQFVGEPNFRTEQTAEGLWGRYNLQVYPQSAYYYNTTTGTSYTAINKLDYLDKWIIDFGGNQLGRITQDKGYDFLRNGYLWVTYYVHKDINLLIKDIFKSAESLEYGKKVLVFDLSDYLTFEYFSTEDYKFHTPNTTDQHLYINVLVNKSENGMVNSEQSMFGLIEGKAGWTYDGVVAEDYWTAHTEINLTEADFEVGSDNLMTLKSAAIEYYSQFDNDYVDIIINIDLDRTLGAGFGRNAFGNLLADKIIITSSTATTFTHYGDLPCVIVASSNVTLEVVQ